MSKTKLIEVSDACRAVLNAAKCEGSKLVLAGQLDRKAYERVNELLEAVGFKWSKKEKAHICPDECGAQETLNRLLAQNAVVDQQQTYQVFLTPPLLARTLVEAAWVTPGMAVLEPSAGGGRIAEKIEEAGGIAHCCEIREDAYNQLVADGFHMVYKGDFLQMPLLGREGTYRAVVMNPPFTGDQDIDHVMHAWKFLAEGGRLVAIMSPRYTFVEQSKPLAFREFLSKYGVAQQVLEAGTFGASGTNVRSMMVILQKPVTPKLATTTAEPEWQGNDLEATQEPESTPVGPEIPPVLMQSVGRPRRSEWKP
jgi:hypothetical protein